MTYREAWARGAAKFYKRLDDDARGRVDEAIDELLEDPLHAASTKPLSGPLAGLRSRRIGNLRLIYSFEPDSKVVYIHDLADRKDVYRHP